MQRKARYWLKKLILFSGQVLHIIPDDTIYDPKRLMKFLKDRKITRMLFTPSLLEAVVDVMNEKDDAYFETMKLVNSFSYL